MPRLASVTGGFAGFSGLGISLAPPSSGAISVIGLLYSSGDNTYGEIGDDTTTNASSVVAIGNLSWKQVSAGANHVMALRSDDLLFGWGNNINGAVGDGTFDNRSSPVQIGSSSWTNVAAGESHSMAIRSDGLLFGWGRNSTGDLGIGYSFDDTNAPSWTSVVSSSVHTLAIKSDGTLWAWGSNSVGELGLNDVLDRSSPIQVGTNSWISVAAGSGLSFGIKSDGTLWSWGSGRRGSMGLGIADTGTYSNIPPYRSSPTQIGSSNTWSKVYASSGQWVAGAIDQSGNLYMWGDNSNGIVDGWNYNATTSRSTPWQVGTNGTNSGLTNGWSHVTITGGMAAGIRNGYLYTWGGYNSYGGLGRGYSGTASGTTFATVGNLNGWTDVFVTTQESVAAIRSNLLFTWGNNSLGQLGQNNKVNLSSPVQVGTGYWSRVYGSSNLNLQGLSSNKTRWLIGGGITDVSAGNAAIFPKAAPGSTVTFYYRSSPVQLGTKKWKSLELYGASYFAIDNKDLLWFWGINSGLNGLAGKVGPIIDPYLVGGIGEYASPQLVGRTLSASTFTTSSGDFQAGNGNVNGYSLALYGTSAAMNSLFENILAGDTFTIEHSTGTASLTVAEKGIYSSGGGEGGYWVIPIIEGDSYSGITSFTFNASSPKSWTTIAASKSGTNTLGIAADGTLWAWGSNGNGQTTLPTNNATVPFPNLVSASSWKNISTNNGRAYAIRNDDLLFGWGKNSDLLGDATSVDRSSPVQIGTGSWKQVSAGVNHTVGITSGDALYGWGNYVANQIEILEFDSINLGIYYSALTYASDVGFVGVGNNKLYSLANASNGFGLPRSYITQVGSDSDWSKAVNSDYRTFGIKTDGTLWLASTYGSTSFAQVGSDTWIDVGARGGGGVPNVHMGIKNNGTLWYWTAGSTSPANPGDGSTAGSATPAQVGSASNWTKLSVNGENHFIINSLGQLWGWGGNSYGGVGINSTVNTTTLTQIPGSWSQVSAGSVHTLAIKDDGTLWAWGYNGYGELGLGDTANRSSPVQVGARTDWAKVSAGYFTSFAIDNSGKLWSWGDNWALRLGHFESPYSPQSKSSPTQVGTDNWHSVVSGPYTTYALKTSPGQLYVWGYNYGNYGQGPTTEASATSQIGTGLNTGNVFGSPTQVVGSSGLSWKGVSAGNNVTFAIANNNALYAWGNSDTGVFGNGSIGIISSVTDLGRSAVAVSAASDTAYFLQ